MRVTIVPTGTANTASVAAAVRRVGAVPLVASGADEVDRSDRVILPGVGSFGAAMAELDRTGMREVLQRRLAVGRPTLAICVGMQLLAAASEESEGVPGLGHVSAVVGRFSGPVRVPQLGWNHVTARPGCRFIDDGWAYFANSYRIEEVAKGWAIATTDHGGNFVASMEKGEVLACQFHPELSGEWGSRVLARWLGTERSVP